ncbi:hypothetical protein B0H34DRAFT_792420 [Crassisporium funariophilum]|nr:hypothetical protein B0H34DRAFT_792420 [Crassisporium funariophilum]
MVVTDSLLFLLVLFSGSHPFEHEPQSSSNWISRIKDSRRLDGSSQLSTTYSEADMNLKERIVYGEVEFLQDPWLDLPDARSLVESLLSGDYQQRATVQCALKSDWISSELAVLEELYRTRISNELSC